MKYYWITDALATYPGTSLSNLTVRLSLSALEWLSCRFPTLFKSGLLPAKYCT